jgi:hypothetical protein
LSSYPKVIDKLLSIIASNTLSEEEQVNMAIDSNTLSEEEMESITTALSGKKQQNSTSSSSTNDSQNLLNLFTRSNSQTPPSDNAPLSIDLTSVLQSIPQVIQTKEVQDINMSRVNNIDDNDRDGNDVSIKPDDEYSNSPNSPNSLASDNGKKEKSAVANNADDTLQRVLTDAESEEDEEKMALRMSLEVNNSNQEVNNRSQEENLDADFELALKLSTLT